ncbi:hypothetical protein K435DRAFT_964324 [Dendrothele bispora CBS 962.96]|uniref:Uncharacterized protein n=1 Tax=Dendrothele bispora (strain CBS 962.96) TaxID=1314807 RepID=A0A4S8MCH5_DENBC|nr:hypothetical protein K435DRAFT_964324 [Dendrothele bispora CBS 962.96]
MSNKMPQLSLPPMGTRSTNRTAHPGLPDAKGKRRTPQEMAEARAQEQKAKEAKAATMKASIQKAAQIEDRQRQEDLKRQEESRTEKPKVNPKARQVSGANSQGVESGIQRGLPSKKSGKKMTYESDESNVSMSDAPKRGEIVIEGFDSGSDEYEPQDSEDETSGDVDLEVQKRTTLKVSRSAITQHHVTKAAVGTPAVNVESSHHKRKASGEKTKGKGKKTKTHAHAHAVAGLNTAFKKQISRVSSSDASMVLASEPESDSLVHFGGLNDENPEVERSSVVATSKVKPEASVKIEHIEVKKPRTRKEARDGDKKWKMSHLPGGNATQKLFQSAVVPLFQQKAGTLLPWTGLDTEDHQVILNTVFGEGTFVTDGKDVWDGLLGYAMTNWRSAIGQAGIDVVKDFINDNADRLNSSDMIAFFVESFLALSPKGIEVYIFEEYDHVKQRGKGILMSPLIIKTFAKAHYSKPRGLAALKDEMRIIDKPIGAVLLCTVSIARALNCWKNGVFEYNPKTNPTHQFSAKNWGDTAVLKDGRMVPQLRSTKFLETLKSRDDKWWDDFYEKVKQANKAEGGDDEPGTVGGADPQDASGGVPPVVYLSDSDDSDDAAPEDAASLEKFGSAIDVNDIDRDGDSNGDGSDIGFDGSEELDAAAVDGQSSGVSDLEFGDLP